MFESHMDQCAIVIDGRDVHVVYKRSSLITRVESEKRGSRCGFKNEGLRGNFGLL